VDGHDHHHERARRPGPDSRPDADGDRAGPLGGLARPSDRADLQALLAPAASGGLVSYPVSTAVNSVRNNGPELIKRIELARPG
jgi:hypothetical protein